MASNRYTQLQPTQYQSQYIPLPFQELAQIGQMQQKKADDTLDSAYKLQDLMNSVKSIDQHSPYKKQLHDKYYQKIEDLTNRIVDKGDLTAGRDLNKVAREWMNDPLRQELENSYLNYEVYKKDKIAKGDKYGQWWDPTNKFKGTLNEQIEPFRYTGMGERQDHQKRAEEMMNNIKASGSDQEYFNIDPNTGNILSIKKGYEGIGQKRVKQLAEQKIGDFLSTKEGEDYAREFMFRNPDKNQVDLLNSISTYLYNAGSNQIFGKSSSGQDFNYAPEYINKQKTTKEFVLGEDTPIVNLTQNIFDTDKLSKSLRFDNDFFKSTGELTETALKLGIKSLDENKLTKEDIKKLEATGITPKYGKLNEQEQKIYDNLSKHMFPNITNKDELNGKIKQYLDNMSNQQISTYAETISNNIKFPSGKNGAEGLTETVFGGNKVGENKTTGNYIDRNFYDPETGKLLSGTQFFEQVLSEQEKDTPITINNQYSNKNPFTILTGDDKFSRSYQVTIGNKQYIMSGANKEIIRTPEGDQDQSQYDKLINKISRVQFSPDKFGEFNIPAPVNGTFKYTKAEIQQTNDGFTMYIPEIDASFSGPTEESVVEQYHQLLKK